MGTSKKKVEIQVSARDKASRVLKKITGAFKKWGVGSLKITGALVAGVAAVTIALGAMFAKLSASIDEQAKMASALGLSNEALGVMRDAAGYAGISVSNLNTALRKMSQGIGDAANGTGEAKDALEKLGLSAADLQRMGPEKAFQAIIKKLSEMKSGIQKTTITMDLFGRSGAAMGNLTSKGLKQAQKDADDLKLKLTSAQAANVEASNDAWSRIKNTAGDFLKYITAKLAPGIKDSLDKIFAFIKGQDLKAWATRAALGISRAFQATVVVLGAVAEAVIAITRGMAGAVDIVNKMTKLSLSKMLNNSVKDLDQIEAKIKKLEDSDGWGWPENQEELAKLNNQRNTKTRSIEGTQKALVSAQDIEKIVHGVSTSLAAVQGFSTSPEVSAAMSQLEEMVRNLDSKGTDTSGGQSAKATAGRIEIAFSGTEKAINIAKERTKEFNDILKKTGGIAGLSADTTVDHLGRISSILGDIKRKADAAGTSIGNIPPMPSGGGGDSAEDFANRLEEAADR